MKPIVYHPKQVRIFLALLLALGAALTLRLTRHTPGRVRLALLAVEVLVIAILFALPRIFFPLFRAIMTVSRHFGNLIFSLITLLVYFLILSPLALIMRALGKRFLYLHTDQSLASYFEEADAETNLEKQY